MKDGAMLKTEAVRYLKTNHVTLRSLLNAFDIPYLVYPSCRRENYIMPSDLERLKAHLESKRRKIRCAKYLKSRKRPDLVTG